HFNIGCSPPLARSCSLLRGARAGRKRISNSRGRPLDRHGSPAPDWRKRPGPGRGLRADERLASWAGPAEESGLESGIRRFSAQPDGQERPCEVVTLNRALRGPTDAHLNARAWLMREGDLLAGLHVRH